MLKKYQCKGCGAEFEAQDWRKRKYCSKRCKGLYDKSGQFKKGHKWDRLTEARRIKTLQANPSYGMLGKKHSEKTKKQMSESSKFPYNYVDGGYNGKIETKECEICGEIQKKILIHHKDGNRKNNKIQNLVAVCDKCHSRMHFPNGKLGKNLER